MERCDDCGKATNMFPYCSGCYLVRHVEKCFAENRKLHAVAKAATKVRDARRAFLATLKTVCPDRSPALEEAEAEMDAALEAWGKS